MAYYDLMLASVPTAKRAEYEALSEKTLPVFTDAGALSIAELWGDDVPEGKKNSLHTAVLREDGEEVAATVIIWPSREARDAGMAKVMADPRMQPGAIEMPFDGSRMIFGGFQVLMASGAS